MAVKRLNPEYTAGTGLARSGTALSLSDSGWLDLPLESGWVAYNAAQTPKYRKVGGVVQVVGAVKPTANKAVEVSIVAVGTLPVGFRPSYRTLTLNPASGSNRVTVSAEPSGTVAVSRYGTGSGFVTVATSHWVPITITFLA